MNGRYQILSYAHRSELVKVADGMILDGWIPSGAATLQAVAYYVDTEAAVQEWTQTMYKPLPEVL